MRPLGILALVVGSLVILLTYFLVQGLVSYAPRQQRADALDAIILHNAALQRDVLRSRAGLLRSYDPLVRSMDNLLQAIEALPPVREIASGEVRVDIDRRIGELRAAVHEHEAIVETFKSDNALLQNSLAYFNHLSGRLAAVGGGRQTDLHAEIGTLTTAMLRFTNAPLPDAAGEVRASLDRVAALPVDPALAQDVRSLVSHGRLAVSTLPRVDDLVARIQSAPTSGQARALQSVYFAARERAAQRADLFLALLYVAALALVAYVAYLFVCLRANARSLKQRLDFESLIASTSTLFINLPRDDVRAAVSEALARLTEHAGLDRAEIIIVGADGPDLVGSHVYQRLGSLEAPRAEAARIALRWRPQGYERQGCICVPDVAALPESPEKADLQKRGVQSWLSIPLRVAGEHFGILALEATAAKKHWQDDDVALFRTAAEIFINAIARQRGEVEREALQARLNQSQRLEAIGTLAGGIAHEFNNILGAIRGHSEMALAVLVKESRARRHVEHIMKGGERAQNVVEQILAFGRRREREFRPIRIEPVVAEAIDLVRASLPATLAVRTQLKGGGGAVLGDSTEIAQVIMNLCTNAAQAMEGRGILTLTLDTVDTDKILRLSHGGLSAGRYLRLIVRDTGPGIDQATMERIFEPFFTTKPVGQGTGLGLSTVHGIVGGHGGALNVQSRRGKGATFEVYLPRAEEIAADAGTPLADEGKSAEPPPRRGHGETVLIVDDEKTLVHLGEEMLAALGYEPVGFGASRTALAAFRSNPERFDLVLTDEIMPKMTGTELAGAVHEVRPGLPVVLMTGYDHPLQSARLQAAGIRDVLRKPLLSRALADCLARHLPDKRDATRPRAGRPFQP